MDDVGRFRYSAIKSTETTGLLSPAGQFEDFTSKGTLKRRIIFAEGETENTHHLKFRTDTVRSVVD